MPPFPGNPQTTNYPQFSGEGSQGHGSGLLVLDKPGPSGVNTRSTADSDEETEDGDVVQLLDQAEALELIEFDPTVDPKDTWKSPQVIQAFLEKHFNCSLSGDERVSILKDFPKPQCGVMSAPKLDEKVKEQLKMRGKDPHYGSEKSLYKLQEQVLDVAGPLTCLWSDLLNKEAKVANEDVLLLLQRALVLVGSASQCFRGLREERDKFVRSRLHGKKIEADKTIAKVAGASKGPPPA